MAGSSGINLMLATMDLMVVQSVLGAMHAADVGAAAAAGNGSSNPEPHRFRPAAVYTPTPRFEPRVVYHPTPRFESRLVYHPTPRMEPKERCPEPCHPEHRKVCPPGVPPVWKTLPDIAPRSATQQIKAPVIRPDIRHKGSLIDTFI
jgi:hypothetical protein